MFNIQNGKLNNEINFLKNIKHIEKKELSVDKIIF
jgi:hypothetical protein